MYRLFRLAESRSILRGRLGKLWAFFVVFFVFLGHLHIDGFDDILDEFPPSSDCVKPLYRKMRGLLFPLLEDGALFTRTPSDPPEELYHPIIESFEDVMENSKN